MSQWLKESDPGESVKEEEGENSGTEENVTFHRDGREFALGHEMLQLCFGSADPAAEPLLLSGRGGEACQKSEKDLLVLSS